MPFLFTTLTLVDNLPISSLCNYLSTKSKWLYVHEYGKDNDNHHIHALFYVPEEEEKRSDKYTKQLQNLYDKEFLKNLLDTSKLVRTKQAPKWQLLYKSYLLKESVNKKFEDLKYEGFEKTMLQRLFKEAGCENILRSHVKVSLCSAPQYIYNYMKEKKIPRGHPYSRIMEYMMADGYIMHHLIDDKTLDKIKVGLDNLMYPQTYKPQVIEFISDDIL